MASKKGAKTVQLDGEIYHNFKKAIDLEKWRYGTTAKIEELILKYAEKVLKA